MRIIFLFVFALQLMCFNSTQAQVFSYLNASAGNEGHYIVDADTNVIMYHGNQLEKLDKNFNPIWVKSYSALEFYSLLLSKTGSLYFISTNIDSAYFGQSNVIGKLDLAGNIVWCKTIKDLEIQSATNTYSSTNNSFNQIILDRNNNLVLTGTSDATSNTFVKAAIFLKMDTAGVVLSFKNMIEGNTGFNKVIVTDDSLGNYQIIWDANFFESSGAGGYNYIEAQDTISQAFSFSGGGQFSGIITSKYLKSKYDPNTFYSLIMYGINPFNANECALSICKHFKNAVVWRKMLSIYRQGPIDISSLDEDAKKNLLFTITWSDAWTHFTNGCYKIDSLGSSTVLTKGLLSYYCSSAPTFHNNYLFPKLNVLYGQKYFYDVYGCDYPSNPLTLTVLDSSLAPTCGALTSFSLSSSTGGIYYGWPKATVGNIVSYSDSGKVVSVSNVINFSVIQDTCIDASVNEKNNNSISLVLSPNPATNELCFEISNKIDVKKISIVDINGKEVYSIEKNIENPLNIAYLAQGLYLLKITTDHSLISQKFIKE